jgi:hypothetical protein
LASMPVNPSPFTIYVMRTRAKNGQYFIGEFLNRGICANCQKWRKFRKMYQSFWRRKL